MSRKIEEALEFVLISGSLEPLAALTSNPDLAERLRTLRVGKPTATDIQIQARITQHAAEATGWTNPADIIDLITDRHLPKARQTAAKIVCDEGRSKVNRPAKEIFLRYVKPYSGRLSARIHPPDFRRVKT